MDVFFVVSGFLITALLLREFDARGRIALRGFYARRARRSSRSLSVEEQFYLVWPVLLFGLSLWSTMAGDELCVAYHSTLDRAWQFGAGALLAGL